LTGDALENDRLSGGKQTRLTARAHRTTGIADDAPRHGLIDHLRQVIFVQRMHRRQVDAQLARRQPPPRRRQHRLHRQRANPGKQPDRLSGGKNACCFRTVGNPPKEREQPDGCGKLTKPHQARRQREHASRHGAAAAIGLEENASRISPRMAAIERTGASSGGNSPS
jgi:hypothetical protein